MWCAAMRLTPLAPLLGPLAACPVLIHQRQQHSHRPISLPGRIGFRPAASQFHHSISGQLFGISITVPPSGVVRCMMEPEGGQQPASSADGQLPPPKAAQVASGHQPVPNLAAVEPPPKAAQPPPKAAQVASGQQPVPNLAAVELPTMPLGSLKRAFSSLTLASRRAASSQ